MSSDITTEVKEEKKKGKGKAKITIVLMLTVLLAAGTFFGVRFYIRGVNYITTDNARVTTNIITIISPTLGRLERYLLSEGMHVERDEIIGWIENGGPVRSPINGLVVRSYVVENQMVSPMEPLAVIADTNRIHIQANIEETDIMRIQRGQPATVTIDALGSVQLEGYVSDIGLITQAELAGTALFFNTGGTFTRVTHLIPVEIVITDDIDLESLIGVNARVQIRIN